MANMITLLPIEPLNDAHGMLIVEAFSRLFVNRGGKEDGDGCGWGYGDGHGGGDGHGDGWGDGDGWGWGYGGKCPEEWRVPP